MITCNIKRINGFLRPEFHGGNMSFKIAGTGSYVPERVVTNDELSKYVDTSDEWIKQRIGISERHISTNETAGEMGYRASLSALESAGYDAAELDLIIGATVSGEDVSPSVSCTVQHMLGINCMAFDINAACSAFIFLLDVADGFIKKGFKKILIVGAERLSRIVDWTDRSTCVIFGDGAGAAVLEPGENYISSVFHVKGGDEVLKIGSSHGNSPFFTRDTIKPYITMNGQETFKFAVNSICADTHEILEKAGVTLDDIAYIVPHQANARIIDFAAKRMGIPKEKFFRNIERYGNTSSASIPIALSEMNSAGLIKRGDLLVLSAFGAGLASAACLIKW